MNTVTYQSFIQRYVRLILRWRWLVALGGSLTTLFYEIVEHQPIDVDFIREVSIYGVMGPVIAWWLMTTLANNMAQRARLQDDLDQHQRFTQQLEQCQAWREFVDFVTRYPGTILPLERVALFVYDHREARLRLVSSRSRTDESADSDHDYLVYKACHTCLLAKPQGLRRAAACLSPPSSSGGVPAEDYCVPLICQNLLVGVLHLQCQSGQSLPADQVDFLNSVAPELALALTISIAQWEQMEEIRRETLLDERRRVAYALHDSLAQQLGYLQLSLDRLVGDDRLVGIEDVRRELEYARDAARDAYEQTRSNLSILRSQRATDLIQVIENHAQTVSQRTGLGISISLQGEPIALSRTTCEEIVGLVRESLNNAERHARARHVQIILIWSIECLSIHFVDDGVGFDPTDVGDGHFGLAMMRERVKALAGEFAMDSAPGRGTRLSFKLPLPLSPAGNPPRAAAALDPSTFQDTVACPVHSREIESQPDVATHDARMS